jgi:hypothetical protein
MTSQNCADCGRSLAGYRSPRTQCYTCKPKRYLGPAATDPEAPCRSCGDTTLQFYAGLCRRCHRLGEWIDSCPDCLAWGVTRRYRGLCLGCRAWRKKYPGVGPCQSCRRDLALGAHDLCRLCSIQAHGQRLPHHPIDAVTANRHGQQLFFADMARKARRAPAAQATQARPTWPAGYPVGHEQPALFDIPRDITQTLPPLPIPELAIALEQVAGQHAEAHGWRRDLTTATCRSIRILLAVQDTPGARIKAAQAALLLKPIRGAALLPVLEVLAAADMLEDDRRPAIDGWLDRQTEGLPEPMRTEAQLWIHVLRHGSQTPPRSHPLGEMTLRAHVPPAITCLRTFADQGHTSLREITRDDVMAAFPTDPRHRKRSISSLRSLFRLLKARRVIFTNPTTRLRLPILPPNHALPADIAVVRAALDSANPACAAIAALAAFHALHSQQIKDLRVTDVRDGQLHVDGRTIPLAEPVRQRLASWLDERNRRWPATANPHMFLTAYAAVRTTPVSDPWLHVTLGVAPRILREDRILFEAMTGGDARRLIAMFGMTVFGTSRYTHSSETPMLTGEHAGSRTREPE